MKSNRSLSAISRAGLFIAAALIVLSAFFPLWRIELDAPQYPEGLVLQLHANKLSGDVEIINGLNHYIGMKTLHTEDFFEFKIIPYILGALALFTLIVAILPRRKSVIALLITFILLGVIGGLDFYRWNYEYGHNLDPQAAIQVPGMAYQPPVLGFKQLLNFGAYSIPDTGGLLLFGAAFIVAAIVLFDVRPFRRRKTPVVAALTMLLFFSACKPQGPVPIQLNTDQCDFCKMSVSDPSFGAEVITKKGRVYKFDDLSCLVAYVNENPQTPIGQYYVNAFGKDNVLIDATTAHYIEGGAVHSPMNGNFAAFETSSEAQQAAKELQAKPLNWDSILSR